MTRDAPVVDALGRPLPIPDVAPRRVVSLVPSETATVVALAGPDRLVGRTRYCVEPANALRDVPVVGGTKDVDVDAVAGLAPDLVLANKEENGRAAVEALIRRGLPVHVSFPRSAAASVDYVEDLAVLLAVDPPPPWVDELRASVARRLVRPRVRALRVFVPIWRDPWMTFDGRAFASDLLELAGFHNAFSDRPRRYPLAADLGRRPARRPEEVGDRDTRYPRVGLNEVAERAPDVILLPDEPYVFGEADRHALLADPMLADVPAVRAGRVRCVSGKDLFWYGQWVLGALPRLETLASTLHR